MATKSDIIAKVAKRHPLLDKIFIAAIVDSFFLVLSSALKYHSRVEIRGFGSFSIRSYNLKETSNLMLQKVAKHQYFKTYFRSSKKLSNLINE
ncbi:HU family DNA-binding protein [Wolbachia endosymbiont of Armadillidium vulgare str. wVulC]|uniref:HU family DNA-binding protein n=1 Tax=Wolbachia endosymbiont of Armadillidium arcangelii TaxID=3158571 RepID=A0AAU7Q2C6_9RICK|nr:HU family DNA-binding protein [Wolbachia endosymbiont of Armadillidium vulgare]KLT22212.1 HU family DNA-binding protein [Wolbachia endosymbiont of Armadillidium vulgare str. wVulC]OJH31574.1 Integration host factor subunit beta [Wolbachia endosymbiont of Armadillidium vulgare]OJH32204.1 Integration host factor subunit beta [Wolbachia endosymbiont of Armadillidium vulgare]OJH32999.1 Integration host factor subunit beta [Wolbachia endosymbiont of Armadillidium vulgare]